MGAREVEYANHHGSCSALLLAIKYSCSISHQEFIDARPSAELLPLSAGEQDDESESEMGLTYDELSTFGVLRKVRPFGPAIQSLASRHADQTCLTLWHRSRNSARGHATCASSSNGKTGPALARSELQPKSCFSFDIGCVSSNLMNDPQDPVSQS